MFKNYIFFLFVLLASYNLSSQDIPADVSTISDGQLKEAVGKAQQQGLTPSQVEAMARAKGLSASEISALRSRVQQLQATKGETTIDDATLRDELSEFDLDFEGSEALLNDLIKGEIEGAVFGSELFNSTALTFAPSLNIPTPPTYQLGPGDELIIDVWGDSEKTYQVVLGVEGVIKLPAIGPIYINGLEINKATDKILNKLGQIYSGLGKNTYAQISLGRIRSIRVNVIGEVKRPGTYTISSLSTVLHAMYESGGPSENGSYRMVQVFRRGKEFAKFDLYDFLIKGGATANVTLQDQDVIKIPVYDKRVKLTGEIKRPAIYELKSGERLSDVLGFCGGFTDEAYSKLLTIRRKTSSAKKILTIKSENFNEFELVSGDEIEVSEILDTYENRVTIQGAVYRPGEYELNENLTLSELIKKAEGVSADAFLGRGHILRYNEDLSLSNVEFNVRKVLNGLWDIHLTAEDIVTIKSNYDLKDEEIVYVQGEVRQPRAFAFQDSLTVEDVIFMSGGFQETAMKSFVEVARRTSETNSSDPSETSLISSFEINEMLNISKEASTFILEPFDIVTVRRSPFYNKLQSVEIEGEISYPGKYVLARNDERISDLIRRSGGFTNEAFPKGGTLIRETEYFDEAKAAQVKKLRIVGLGNIDSTATEGTFSINRNEAIAIELEEIIKNPGSDIDLILKEGDVISVPKKLQTVRVRGEVYFSSNLIYDNRLSFRDYVSMAGGGTERSRLNKSYIVYPNGSAGKTTSFLWFKNYPNVEPGSEIIIPAKGEKRRLSPQEIIGITTGIGTIALIINNLTR